MSGASLSLRLCLSLRLRLHLSLSLRLHLSLSLSPSLRLSLTLKRAYSPGYGDNPNPLFTLTPTTPNPKVLPEERAEHSLRWIEASAMVRTLIKLLRSAGWGGDAQASPLSQPSPGQAKLLEALLEQGWWLASWD